MKFLCALVVGLVVTLVPLVRAQDDGAPAAPRFTRATIGQSEQSLIQALLTNSDQMQITGSLTIKDLKTLYPQRSFQSLVIPLMAVVKNEKADCNARIAAAVALSDLNSAMGDYAISSTALFTKDERVQHACIWLAYSRLLERHPELAMRHSPPRDETELTAEVRTPKPEFSVQPLEEMAP